MLPVAENGYTDEEMDQYTRQLKEDGIVNFLRSYLTLTEDGEMRSLRKLLLGFGLVPVGRCRSVVSIRRANSSPNSLFRFGLRKLPTFNYSHLPKLPFLKFYADVNVFETSRL